MNSQKRIASKILKCGVSRIRIKASKEVEEALTREDVRNLIRKGFIWKEQKKGTAKFNVKQKLRQKKKGRMKGHGSRKGTRGARKPRKKVWIESVRPLRKLLRELRDSGKIDKRVYRKIYLMIKGGSFRNKKHLLYYLKDHELMKVKEEEKKEKRGKKKTKTKKPKPKKKPEKTKKKPKSAKKTKSKKKVSK